MSPLIIVVLVTAGERASPAIAALEQAVRETLGAETLVRTREVANPPDDDELAAVATAEHASSVTRLRWVDDERREATLRIYVARPESFIDRTLTFAASDVLTERGRALGLVIAAAFPNPRRSQPPPPPQIVARPPPPERSFGWTLELAAVAAAGVGGVGGGVGGGGAVRWLVGDHFALRAGVRGRVGEVDAASASSRTFVLGLGPSFRFTEPGARIGLGIRADGLLVDQSLSHFSGDEPAPVRRGHLLPGADLLAEVELRLAGGASLVVSSGAEVVFGKTEIFLRGARVAVLPPLRVVAEGGFRIRL